jgi:universal stress protein E
MESIQNILVIADSHMLPSAALGRAASVAHLTGARLWLCLIAYEPVIATGDRSAHPDIYRLAQNEYVGERERWLGQRAVSLRDQGLKVHHEVVWSASMYEAIVAKAIEHRVDLVIKEISREHSRWRHTSADWKLIRYCPSPLMLVRPDAHSHPGRIAAAVDAFQDSGDGAAFNELIVRTAQWLGKTCSSESYVVSAFPWRHVPSANEAKLAVLLEQASRDHRLAFTQLCDRLQVDATARYHLMGNAGSVLKKFVEERRIDLVVLGSHYHSLFSRLVIGSTAEELLAELPSDLLLVKPAGFMAELAQHLDLPALARRYCPTALTA